MKKILRILTIPLFTLLFFGGCEEYIQGIDPYIDRVQDDQLDNIASLPFLVTGVKVQFAITHDNGMLQAGALSDELIFDTNVKNATYPSFKELDEGYIEDGNVSVGSVFNNLGELRFFADDLIRRTDTVADSAETEDDDDIINEANFTGYLYGGLARSFYASYFGLTEKQGGGVISTDVEAPGPFIASADMYDLAIAKFTTALDYTDAGSYEESLVNSLIARNYLFKGAYANAATFAAKGLVDGDDPLVAKYSPLSTNEFWQHAGVARTQLAVDPRFEAYLAADSLEVARIPIILTEMGIDTAVQRYQQDKYPEDSSPIPVITWQENELMIAELVLRGAATGDAVAIVNAVRTSHGLADLASVDLAGLFVERDKELFCQGARLIDQRRADPPGWHLAADTWQYLPITIREKLANENF